MNPLWWLMDAKRYKEEQQRKKTELVKAEFETHVTNALGGKY